MNPFFALSVLGGAFYWWRSRKKAPRTVVFDVLPATAEPSDIPNHPSTDTEVTYTPDCSVIAVPLGWWHAVAKPFVMTSEGNDTALELVLQTVPCGAEATGAVAEFLDRVDESIRQWQKIGDAASVGPSSASLPGVPVPAAHPPPAIPPFLPTLKQ